MLGVSSIDELLAEENRVLVSMNWRKRASVVFLPTSTDQQQTASRKPM